MHKKYTTIVLMLLFFTTTSIFAEKPSSVYSSQNNLTILQGSLLVASLKASAKKSGWNLIWHIKTPDPETWIVPATTTFNGTFIEGFKSAMESLRSSGVNVLVNIYEQNKVVIVDGNGALITNNNDINSTYE